MGAVEEAFGKLTGDTTASFEGAAEKAAGKARDTAISAEDMARDPS